MAGPREVLLNEIRIHSHYLDDALAAILHTILFLRAPSAVKAKDQACQTLSPLIFAKCGPKEVDRIIDSSIEAFKASLFPCGGCLKGEITLSFFDKHEVKEYMGWVTRSENVCFEVWRFSVTLLDASVGDGIAAIAAVAGTSEEKAAQYKSAYDQVTAAMLKVFEAVNTASDHVPLSMYDYEICVTKPTVGGGNGSAGNGSGGDVHRRSDSTSSANSGGRGAYPVTGAAGGSSR